MSSAYSDPALSRPSSTSLASSSLSSDGYAALPTRDSPLSSHSRNLPPLPPSTMAGTTAAPVADPFATPPLPEMREVPSASWATRQESRVSHAQQNVPSETYWPAEQNAAGSQPRAATRSRKKWWIIGGIVAFIVVAAAVGAGVGVSLSKKGSTSGSGSSSGSSSSGGSNSSTSNPNDPTQFAKNPNLHQSFWGFAYTPQGSQPPTCGATQANVTADIQILSQLTTRLRLYGGNCNETALVLQAIKDTKVNMQVWLAIYVDTDTNAYNTQFQAIQSALKTYGTDNIEGIIVGNEYILDTAGSSTNTSTAYTTAADYIISLVQSVNQTVNGQMGLNKYLPIGTSDAGSVLSTTLAKGIDFYMANVHPFFGAVAIDDAATWTYEFFEDFDVSVAATAKNKPQAYIAETGWPTNSLDAADLDDGAGSPQGDASVANLQTFLNDFLCQANNNGTQYFYFEAFDEPWKAQYGGVEPYWGLFDSNRNLKNITIPSC